MTPSVAAIPSPARRAARRSPIRSGPYRRRQLIANLQALICIAESGWDEELKARENPFGIGVLSTLYFARSLRVHSLDKAFRAATDAIINGDDIDVIPAPERIGTEIIIMSAPKAGPDTGLRATVAVVVVVAIAANGSPPVTEKKTASIRRPTPFRVNPKDGY